MESLLAVCEIKILLDFYYFELTNEVSSPGAMRKFDECWISAQQNTMLSMNYES